MPLPKEVLAALPAQLALTAHVTATGIHPAQHCGDMEVGGAACAAELHAMTSLNCSQQGPDVSQSSIYHC